MLTNQEVLKASAEFLMEDTHGDHRLAVALCPCGNEVIVGCDECKRFSFFFSIKEPVCEHFLKHDRETDRVEGIEKSDWFYQGPKSGGSRLTAQEFAELWSEAAKIVVVEEVTAIELYKLN